MSSFGHKHSASVTQNLKAQLANAYNELGKELSSSKIKVVGNYTLGKVIGEGSYGKVRMGTHRLMSTKVAIKQIPKSMSSALTREIHHHRRLHHPHVAQLYEVIASESYIWLVTELCSGGELFDYLVEKGHLNEDETKSIFGQLCLAVGYIHEKGIVHRDLKLENVLLDERCRVKLSDFGFTREFEKGLLLETYCGTTGYAAPEMLQGKKYTGPEVDVWSLGIILYCLLTGTLPFDDDDEMVMREKIINGKFQLPDWLSKDACDLITNILQHDSIKRFTIPQILAHKWFTGLTDNSTAHTTFKTQSIENIPLPNSSVPIQPNGSSSSATSESSFHSASSEFLPSSPGIPGDQTNTTLLLLHKNLSDSTLKKVSQSSPGEIDAIPPTILQAVDIMGGNGTSVDVTSTPKKTPDSPRGPSHSNVPPSSFTSRTPARTKRRSVSSILSMQTNSSQERPTVFPLQDYAAQLLTPAPLLFSTPLERSLLNSLSNLGFDSGQMVHSVLSDACDASGAMWWMVNQRASKKALDDALKKQTESTSGTVVDALVEADLSLTNSISTPIEDIIRSGSTEQINELPASMSAPQLSFVPPTPTTSSNARPQTPPRAFSPGSLSTPTPAMDPSLSKSAQSTPSSSVKSKRDGKPRSGSVSIMQRATTALEAAGLVRKKSAEVVKDDKDRKDEKEREERSSSGSSRFTKSPPARVTKEPSTPEHKASELTTGSPWVLANNPITHDPSVRQEDTLSSLPSTGSVGKLSNGSTRNRGSLLSTFKLWFHEDRKGKRKSNAAGNGNDDLNSVPSSTTVTSPNGSRSVRGTGKRGGKFARRTAKRASISSRRSSSVNSRRSSVASMHIPHIESPHYSVDQTINISRQRSDPSRRSFTPNSEHGEYPSRPSSIHSASMRPRHKKSPSTSSAGSGIRGHGASSPMHKYHRRGGSGSSTRVVRQPKAVPSSDGRQWHLRSSSTASSVHSFHSSRPNSFYDASENEKPITRTSSPLQSSRSRKSFDDSTPRRSTYNTVLAAHKRQTPFASPMAHQSISRSSWKKAWGPEPPGWQSRTARVPVEVLAISPANQPLNLRDVFSGRQSLNMGDEDDWEDEEEDTPNAYAYVGGVGQTMTSWSNSTPTHTTKLEHHVERPLTLSLPPRGKANRGSKRAGRASDNNTLSPGTAHHGGRSTNRTKPGHSPVLANTSLPSDSGVFDAATSRRQLPNGRVGSGTAFRQNPIQEEDEDEE